MKQTYLALLALAMALSAQAQNGIIKGRVLDEADGQAMVGVAVRIKDSRLGTITDLEGRFMLKNINPGQITLIFSFVGYDEVLQSVEVSAADSTLLEVKMKPNEVGLKEVEVFADMTEDRKTPVAVSGLDNSVINEQFQGMELPEMLNTFPGLYSTQGAGGFGDNDIFIRGFPQTEIAFLVNGIPVNDMENGLMYWSNFAGISEVTRRMEVQRGLGASKLAISSIGGTVNMITKPSERRKGGRLEYALSNGAWNNRLRFTLNTGEMKGGWAISAQGSRTTTTAPFGGMQGHQFGGYRPGAFVDAWSYYVAVNKKINDRHSIMFSAFGAPVNRGTAWNTSRANYERFGSYYFNWAAGYYRGDFFNARQNYAHKPQIVLSHYFNISDKAQLTTSVYTSYARVYSTQPRGAFNSSDLSLRSGDGYILWDNLASRNRAATRQITVNNPGGNPYAAPVTGYNAETWIEARHNNHDWYGLITNLNIDINDKLNVVSGIDLRTYRASHYATVFELFGADFLLDKFGTSDNNMLRPNNVAYKGDRINYDYDGNVRWGAAFVQAEYSPVYKLTLFVTAVGSHTQMWRYGNFWNGNVPQNSLGKSAVRSFTNYNFKAGGTYRLDGRNSFYVNAGNFTRAPYLSLAYEDPRYRNDYLQGLHSEMITAAELGYSYRMSRLRFNLNLYQIEWHNRIFGDSYTDQSGNQVFYALRGQNAIHQGIEAEFIFNATNALEIKGMANLGDWRWKNNVDATVTDDKGQIVDRIFVYADGLPIGNAAQTTAFMGLHYKGIKDVYVGGRVMYFDRIYVAYTPETRTSPSMAKPERLPDYALVSVYGGYYFKIADIRSRIGVNINNLFNTKAASFASVFNGETQLGYVFGRTFNLNLSFDF